MAPGVVLHGTTCSLLLLHIFIIFGNDDCLPVDFFFFD